MADQNDDKKPQEQQPKKRRPYVPPAIEESAPFQRLVLACIQSQTEECMEDPTS